jgi:hypothetical protein
MVKTKFNNHLRIGLLGITVFVFFFLDGGHLITLVTKLIGSEGVRAAAGEVGQHHVDVQGVIRLECSRIPRRRVRITSSNLGLSHRSLDRYIASCHGVTGYVQLEHFTLTERA